MALLNWAVETASPHALAEALAEAYPDDSIFSLEMPNEFGEKWADELSRTRLDLMKHDEDARLDLLLVAARFVEYGRRHNPLFSWLMSREWRFETAYEYRIQEPEADHLSGGCWPFELLAGTSFEDFPDWDDRHKVQALVWFFEAAELHRNGDPKAFDLLFEVAKCLRIVGESCAMDDVAMEERTRARRTLAEKGAVARHAPNRKRAEEIRAWYLANKDHFTSLDQAAERARDEFNCSFRTAREHIGRAKKELLSAGIP
ncbi:MAG: hypothetical protein PHW25_18465 [Zoogloea sp.]|uniref:hypothetical protein n=1 Tax=Zoogloea sp. TaxID=49181 RepID=UPI00262C98C0|nr:hypothetical protein [Zoogloea sp.]MDD3329070.1 hypothetical protein [Zoogloea sp.]